MSTHILIILCVLPLLAYLFDLAATKTKVPSVVMLMLLGWLLARSLEWFEIQIPDLQPALPLLGTVGLILIVLEGAMELHIEAGKTKFILKAALLALLPLVLLCLLITLALHQLFGYPYLLSLLNAIPLCIISSAIAIPSAKALSKDNRDLVTYESSLSDVLGVILFNFFHLNEEVSLKSYLDFFWQLALMMLISFVVTLGLSVLLKKSRHQIKYIPILLIIILIYTLTKLYHLPGLIFILIFGLFLRNLHLLPKWGWVRRLDPESMKKEIHQLHEMTAEVAFLIRSMFFILFGFLIKTEELLNPDTLLWALSICGLVLLVRGLFLKVLKLPLTPLLFMAPRGLITILLFISLSPSQQLPVVNNSLITQVIILLALIMMFGLMFSQAPKKEPAKSV